MTRRANGEGTIAKRKDGRWVAATYLPATNGGYKRVYVYGRTRAEAREKLTGRQREAARGSRVPLKDWTVQAYLEHWLDQVVKPNRAPKTHQGYELVVRRHIVPRVGRKKVVSLSVQDVRNLVHVLQESGLRTRGVQFVHAVLRAGVQGPMRDELITGHGG